MRTLLCLLTFALLASITSSLVCAQGELEKRATWQQPTTAEVRALLDQWLATRQVDDATLTAIQSLWEEDAAAADVLQSLALSIRLADPTATALVDFCSQDAAVILPPEFEFLQDADRAPLVRNNLRLLYGRWLAQREYYDEALAQLDGLQTNDVADPAALLFYQSICHHRLLHKDACLAAAVRLLENKGTIPKRHETLAMLIEADMSPLETDSLDEIARLMDDVERRLDLGRAGKRVRKQEDDVIAKLDKMIEEIEKKKKQQQSSGSAGQQGGKPMEDSQAAGGSGPGEVEQRRIGSERDWGDLPPKQRQEALQQIGKGLPSHYRQVIEEYFRKLARDGNK